MRSRGAWEIAEEASFVKLENRMMWVTFHKDCTEQVMQLSRGRRFLAVRASSAKALSQETGVQRDAGKVKKGYWA